MVSWRGRDSYFNDKQIQMSAIEIMNVAFGSSGSFGSRCWSQCIGHNIYAGRRSNFRSKISPIHGPVHKLELNFSYSRRYFKRLPQAVSKRLINSFCINLAHASMVIDTVINGFIPNEGSSSFKMCDNSIITFCKIGFCLVFSNTSHVYSLYGLRKLVFEQFHNSIDDLNKTIYQKDKYYLEYASGFIHNMGLGYLTACVYQFIFDK